MKFRPTRDSQSDAARLCVAAFHQQRRERTHKHNVEKINTAGLSPHVSLSLLAVINSLQLVVCVCVCVGVRGWSHGVDPRSVEGPQG